MIVRPKANAVERCQANTTTPPLADRSLVHFADLTSPWSGMVAALVRRRRPVPFSLAKSLGFSARASHGGQAQSSADRLLHKRADLCLIGGGHLLQREGDRPHGAFVEVRRVVEPERGVPRFELGLVLEEEDGLAVLVGVRRHPVPGRR